MSLRVSISRPLISACSGLMYSGVPISCPSSVNSVRSVSGCAVALATPKSMTLGTDMIVVHGDQHVRGLEVAVDDPFLVGVLDASHTWMNSASRSRTLRRWRSQYVVIGSPWTYSMTKYGRPSP